MWSDRGRLGTRYIAQQGCIINPFLKTERRTWRRSVWLGRYLSIGDTATRRCGARVPVHPTSRYFAVLTVFGPSTKGTANSCPASPKLRINHVNAKHQVRHRLVLAAPAEIRVTGTHSMAWAPSHSPWWRRACDSYSARVFVKPTLSTARAAAPAETPGGSRGR